MLSVWNSYRRAFLKNTFLFVLALFLPRFATAGCQRECPGGYTEVCTGYEDNGTCDSYTEECLGGYTTGCTTPSCTLAASPPDVAPGYSSTLTLTPSEPVTSESLSGPNGNVALNGTTAVVSPSATATYTATVSNSGGTAQCSTTVSVFTAASVDGNWLYNGLPVRIQQSGDNFSVIFEGNTYNGYFISPTQLYAPWALITGTVSSNGNTITWYSGSTAIATYTKFTPPSIAGTWVYDGTPFTIQQTGDNFTVVYGGQDYTGYFTTPTQLYAPWASLTGTLSSNGSTITWYSGSTEVATYTQAFTPVHIAGNWIYNGTPLSIQQSGDDFSVVFDGTTYNGYFTSPTQLYAPWASLTGGVSSDGSTITWYSGSSAVATYVQAFTPPNIAGNWVYSGIPLTIQQSGDDFSVVLDGTTYNGYFTSPTQLYAPWGSLTGTLSSNGSTITWYSGSTVVGTYTQASFTAPSIAGNWVYNGTPFTIQQLGNAFTVIYGGQNYYGYFTSSTQLDAPWASLTGTLSGNGNTITWYNGSNAVAVYVQAFTPAKIAGNWSYNGIPLTIQQSGDNFSVVFQNKTYNGYFTSPTQLYAPWGPFTGTLSTDGNTITWFSGSTELATYTKE